MWAQVDLEQGQIHVRRTAYFEPKTEESQRVVDLAPDAVEILRSFKQGNDSEFLLAGAAPNPSATYDYYRCDCTWRELNAWLRAKGVRQQKAIHSLRKESGSLIASTFGIEAARQHLGHLPLDSKNARQTDRSFPIPLVEETEKDHGPGDIQVVAVYTLRDELGAHLDDLCLAPDVLPTLGVFLGYGVHVPRSARSR